MFFNRMYLDPNGDGGAADGTNGANNGAQTGDGAGNGNSGNQSQAIDYAKIQQMLDGTLAAKEDTALKAYFKQQGLSQQEAETAMSDFKKQKAANQPDVGALQAQAAQAREALMQAQLQSAATLAAVTMGIDAKTIPYVLKLADLSAATKADGSIDDAALTEALNKVLTDVPALKPQPGDGAGFMQVGTSNSGTTGNAPGNNPGTATPTTPTKRWNRWN